LDRVASQDLQTLYANCYDQAGGYARATKTVSVTQDPQVTTSFMQGSVDLIDSI